MIGLILAGGESKRFGQDKALYQFADLPANNTQLAVNNLRPFCEQIFISASKTNYPLLSKQFVNQQEIKVTQDVPPFDHHGPLSGLYALTNYFQGSVEILMLAVDYPLITRSELAKLIDRPSYLATATDQHVTIAHLTTSQSELETILRHDQWRLNQFVTDHCQPVIVPDSRNLINFNHYQENTYNENQR